MTYFALKNSNKCILCHIDLGQLQSIHLYMFKIWCKTVNHSELYFDSPLIQYCRPGILKLFNHAQIVCRRRLYKDVIFEVFNLTCKGFRKTKFALSKLLYIKTAFVQSFIGEKIV